MNAPAIIPRGGTAVMARKLPTPPGDLNYFPTPPWATRALFPILQALTPAEPLGMLSVREPACGEGHMAAVLAELFPTVLASDVFPYGYGEVEDYLDARTPNRRAHWVITNPPFSRAQAFIERGLVEAEIGVAMLVRTGFVESGERYQELFSKRPPAVMAQFAEKVPMHKGEWKPDGSTATAYAWMIWLLDPATGLSATRPGETRLRWIGPGQRRALTRFDDARRFARLSPAPLLENDL